MSKLNQFQKDNIAKLLSFLDTLPRGYRKFHMGEFAKNSVGYRVDPMEATECGTVCCLAGHGPAAGIKPLPHDRDDWPLYTYRCFIPAGMVAEWYFLFASYWANIHGQGSIGSAKRRLRAFIADGFCLGPKSTNFIKKYRPSYYT